MATLMKRNALNMSGIGNIRINAGINRFTDEQMDELKANPAFQEMLDSGVLEYVVAPKDTSNPVKENGEWQEPTEGPTANLSEMNVKDAKKIIRGTFNQDDLREMAEEEDAGQKRKSVLDAIDLQIEKLGPTDILEDKE